MCALNTQLFCITYKVKSKFLPQEACRNLAPFPASRPSHHCIWLSRAPCSSLNALCCLMFLCILPSQLGTPPTRLCFSLAYPGEPRPTYFMDSFLADFIIRPLLLCMYPVHSQPEHSQHSNTDFIYMSATVLGCKLLEGRDLCLPAVSFPIFIEHVL